MKIGLVSPYSFSRAGGVQNHILGLADWLSRQGHDVRVAGPGNRDGVTSLGGSVPVPFNGSVARICLDPRASVKLRRWADGLDLVHLHEPLVPLIGPFVRALDVPTVVTCHAASSPRLNLLMAPQLRSWRRSPAIAVSEVAAAAPLIAGLRPAIIGNGIHASLRPGSSTGSVVFVGRSDEPRKGFDQFAAALAPIVAQRGDLRVRVIGSGRSGPAGFEYLGPVSDAERDEVLADSSVFVAPNTRAESFGIVLLEALAAGADVVASDLPAFRELLTDDHGPIARLVPPCDPAALQRAVEQALDEGPVASLARRHAAAQRFDWSRVGPRIVAVYGLTDASPRL